MLSSTRLMHASVPFCVCVCVCVCFAVFKVHFVSLIMLGFVDIGFV